MLIFVLIIFILTASVGIYLLTYVLTNKNTPKGVALIHGSLGALGIILLAINAYYYPWLILLFILVAMGGLFLMVMDLWGKKIPKIVAIGHGSFALISIIALSLIITHFIG